MDARHATRYVPLLRTGRWFQSLPEAFQSELLRVAVVRTLAPGARLFARGDASCGLYAVVEGRVRILGVSPAGKETLLTLVEPPGWFGEISVFDREARTHDAVADASCTLVQVPQAPLDAILRTEPSYWRELGVLLAAKLRMLFATVEDLAALPLGARVARRLLLMSGAYGEWTERSRRVVEVRQEQLAMMHATSRQTMNAVLRDFAARGLVRVSYGQIEILDFDGLRRAGDGTA